MIEKMLYEIYLADPEWSIAIIRYLTEEDHVYTKKDIKVEDMCHIYIDAFKDMGKEKIKTYGMQIENHGITLAEVETFKGYKVQDFTFK